MACHFQFRVIKINITDSIIIIIIIIIIISSSILVVIDVGVPWLVVLGWKIFVYIWLVFSTPEVQSHSQA